MEDKSKPCQVQLELLLFPFLFAASTPFQPSLLTLLQQLLFQLQSLLSLLERNFNSSQMKVGSKKTLAY